MMDEESDHRRTTEEPDTAQKIEYDHRNLRQRITREIA